MQEILQTVIWIIAIVFAVTVAEMIRELHTFRVREYEVISPKLNGIKKNLQVVLLSDLHNHVYGEKNKKLLDEIRKIHPDLILSCGRYAGRKRGYFLGSSRTICRAASGNLSGLLRKRKP